MVHITISKPPRTLTLFLIFTLTFSPAIAGGYSRYDRSEPQWVPGDPCPTSIKAVIPGNGPFGSHNAVHDAMRTCTNISELDIYTSFLGCTDMPERWNLPFALDGSDRYRSATRKLTLESYEFDQVEWYSITPPRPHWSREDGSWPVSDSSNSVVVWATDLFYRARWHFDLLRYRISLADLTSWPMWWNFGISNKWYQWRNLAVEHRYKDNMDLWLQVMDFSQVHELSIKPGAVKPKGDAFLYRLPAALTNLRSLKVDGRWVDWRKELEMWEEAPGPLPKNRLSSPRPPRARDFILALPSLTNLTWTGSETCAPDVFDPVIQHHGPSLRKLEWINTESEYNQRPTLSVDQLEKLGEWAPGLEHLAIDLNRESKDWPNEKLKALAKGLPSLKNLTIYFNLGNGDNGKNMSIVSQEISPSGETLLAVPLLTPDPASDMFQLLRESQDGDRLETVTFKEGNWMNEFGEIYDPSWVDGVRVWVTCSIFNADGERVDDKPWCRAWYHNNYERIKSGAKLSWWEMDP
ncbi:hypothetical protein FDECE_5227 [Fusarium decemcellulare]|nr:hypothetical protein FDECE_5227 [Fusarium decemcellulare]